MDGAVCALLLGRAQTCCRTSCRDERISAGREQLWNVEAKPSHIGPGAAVLYK